MSVTEIAKRAGVSIATVSRVLNEDPRVRPETAEQVQKVLSELSYDRTAIRRGPRLGKRTRKRTHSIVVVALGIPQHQMFARPVYGSVVAGITRAASSRGMNILIDEMVEADKLPPCLQSGNADGALVFIEASADRKLLQTLRGSVPAVRVLGEELTTPEIDQVRPDNLAIGQLAFAHLREIGCEHMAFVTTRPDHEAFLLRAIGFSLAAGRCAGVLPRAFITGMPQSGVFPLMATERCASLEEIADRLASTTPRPTGLFVTHDPEAIGLYPMLAQRGIRPGRDIKFVSCNNEARTLALLRPKPTSIDIGAEEIGRLAVARLANRISRPEDPPMRILVAPRLGIAPGDATDSSV